MRREQDTAIEGFMDQCDDKSLLVTDGKPMIWGLI